MRIIFVLGHPKACIQQLFEKNTEIARSCQLLKIILRSDLLFHASILQLVVIAQLLADGVEVNDILAVAALPPALRVPPSVEILLPSVFIPDLLRLNGGRQVAVIFALAHADSNVVDLSRELLLVAPFPTADDHEAFP